MTKQSGLIDSVADRPVSKSITNFHSSATSVTSTEESFILPLRIASALPCCRLAADLEIDLLTITRSFATDDRPVTTFNRVVLNYYTAKRLLQALGMSVSRHEQAFGVLETNVQKRLEKK